MNFRKSFLTYGLADLLSRTIGLISSPITTRLFTMTQYGSVPLLSAIWAPFSLAQYGGMDWAYPFYLSRKQSEEQGRQYIATASFLAYVSVVLVWGGFLVAAFTGGWLTTYASVTPGELAFFVLGLLPAALIYWLCYLLRFLHCADSYVRVTLLGRIVPVVVVLPLLPLVEQQHRLILSFGLGWLISLVALIYALYEMCRVGHWPFRWNLFNQLLAREMLKYGLFLVPASVAYALISISDRLLVGYFLVSEGVAWLAVAGAIGSAGNLFAGWFGLAFDPHLSNWVASGEQKVYLPKLQILVNSLSCFFSVLTGLAAVWATPVIAVLYPDAYLPSAALVPVILMTSAVAVLSRIGVTTALIAQTPKFHSVLYPASLVANVAIGLIFIPRMGVMGAVLGTLAVEVLILCGWIYFGRIYTKNLPLQWSGPCLMLGLAGVFIVLYQGSASMDIWSVLSMAFWSAVIVTGYCFLLYRKVGSENLKWIWRYVRD